MACDPFFTDCSAVTEPEVTEPVEVPADKKMAEEEHDDMPWLEDKVNPMSGQITFLLVALGVTVGSALKLFRYRSESTYYDAGKILSSNYWKLGDQISLYSWLGLGGVAFLTQLLSVAGIAVDINIMVWMVVLPLVGGLVGLTYSILMFLAYDGGYSICHGPPTPTGRSAGCGLQLSIESEMT